MLPCLQSHKPKMGDQLPAGVQHACLRPPWFARLSRECFRTVEGEAPPVPGQASEATDLKELVWVEHGRPRPALQRRWLGLQGRVLDNQPVLQN